jgi:hypothetical protein
MPTPYERMKQTAFSLMRRSKIKDLSAEELHRAFKHSKEKLIYTAIAKTAIENGLTISSLYEQDQGANLER